MGMLHQTSVCRGRGLIWTLQEGSSRLRSEVPAEQMDPSPDGSSLPSSASCLRDVHVSNTSFGDELNFSSLLWTWSPGYVILDAHVQPLHMSGVICAHCAHSDLVLLQRTESILQVWEACDVTEKSERKQETCSGVYWQQRLLAHPGIID